MRQRWKEIQKLKKGMEYNLHRGGRRLKICKQSLCKDPLIPFHSPYQFESREVWKNETHQLE